MTFGLGVILTVFFVGVVLLGIEVFVAGFGLFGVLGIGAVVASLIMAGATIGQLWLSLGLATAIVAGLGFWAYRRLRSNRSLMYKGLILTDSTSSEKGYLSHADKQSLLGKVGVTLTPLRPAGTAEIEGERIDVVTEGSYLDQQTKIQVYKVDSGRVVVRSFVEPKEDVTE
ncbi:NfeD family protein [Exiguobacterium sp. s150]|uniref:NfeD family protein n=1 Tax=Exiguobacterium sp. s150 TaxID=2751221 RepID=UPI001BE9FDEC|nr:NfeD family protein [Exiguobacterium sp. s150]